MRLPPSYRRCLSWSFSWVLLAVPMLVSAQTRGLLWIDEECNDKIRSGWLTAGCIAKLVGNLAVFFFQGVSMFFLLSVMYAGFQMAMGYISGDKTKGTERLKWSIFGLIITISVVLIMDLVLTVLLG